MDMNELNKKWRRILEILEEEMFPPIFSTWVLPLVPLDFDEEENVLLLSTTEFSLQFLNRYNYMLVHAAEEAFGKPVTTKFQCDKDVPSFLEQEKEPPKAVNSDNSGDINNLDQRYTFDSFVVGNNNEVAYAACQAVAKGPVSTNVNPLFIYGNSGLGKTHLMHAIGHYVLEKDPSKKILCVSSEQFTNELVNSLSGKTMEAFRKKYRNVDYLMIDDIQFIEKKDSTQEELFHTFNTLYSNGNQIVFTSDRPPKDISTIDMRLRSRFEGGLPVDIHEPDFETRVAILKRKAEEEFAFSMEDDESLMKIFYLIAENITTNIRELEGALNRIIAHATLTNKPITKDLAIEVLSTTFDINTQSVDIPLIKDVVCEHFSITVKEIESSSRKKNLAHPRQIAMYLSRQLTEESYPKIGSFFGDRDHSTIMSGCDKIEKELKTDENMRKVIDELKSKIQNI